MKILMLFKKQMILKINRVLYYKVKLIQNNKIHNKIILKMYKVNNNKINIHNRRNLKK